MTEAGPIRAGRADSCGQVRAVCGGRRISGEWWSGDVMTDANAFPMCRPDQSILLLAWLLTRLLTHTCVRASLGCSAVYRGTRS